MPVIPPPTGAGQPWQLNGAAAYSGTDLRLTPNTTSQAGSAVYTGGNVTLDGLYLAFQTEASGGGGADGLTVMFLDPAIESTTSVGSNGGGCGYGGLAGAAVKIETYTGASDYGTTWQWCAAHGGSATQQQRNADSSVGGVVNWTLTLTKTATNTYTAVITKNGSSYATWTGVTAKDSSLLGFSAGTGGFSDNHYIRNFASVPPPPPRPVTIRTALQAVKIRSAVI